MSVFSILYLITACLLSLYGLSTLVLSLLFLRVRNQNQPPVELTVFPRVTVQLPVFNEALVVDRLIQAATTLDWPADRLEIQVLDDSTDSTTVIAQQYADDVRRRGVDVKVLHRIDRSGFKAGALIEGLRQASGEFIVIFDADFVPPCDWLKRTIPHFLARPRLGFLQTRWTHLNQDYSLLTRAQAIALDGHFVVEQTARSRGGLALGFNGTAGAWRRECIEDAGGWQTDTICEDLDLSFRAQLAGWDRVYLAEVTAPAEVPPQLAAFKRQQFRWAKGSVQCLGKLAGRLVTSQLPWYARLMGLVQMGAYLAHPLALLSLLVVLPLLLSSRTPLVSLGFLSLLSVGPPLMYALGQHTLYGDRWLGRYAAIPILMMLGSGIALSNTQAVFEAMFGISNIFERTPKFRIEKRGDRWVGSQYSLPFDRIILGEFAVAAYAVAAVIAALEKGHPQAVPFLMLYVLGFSFVACLGLWDSRQAVLAWFRSLIRRKELTAAQPALSAEYGTGARPIFR